MAEPTFLFTATLNPEGHPEGAIQFEINLEALSTPEAAGFWVHDLTTHLAQALTQAGKSSNYVLALTGVMAGSSDAMGEMISKTEPTQNEGAETWQLKF